MPILLEIRGEKIIYDRNKLHLSLVKETIVLIYKGTSLNHGTILNEIENIKKNHFYLEILFIQVTML